ncbi:hypothetical protein DFH07DRAFT_706127, partial [Mycena maculata]
IASRSDEETARLSNIATDEEQSTLGYSLNLEHCDRGGSAQVPGALGMGDLCHLQQISRKEQHTFNGHSDYVASIAFSPDGPHIVSGCVEKAIRIWGVATGKA